MCRAHASWVPAGAECHRVLFLLMRRHQSRIKHTSVPHQSHINQAPINIKVSTNNNLQTGRGQREQVVFVWNLRDTASNTKALSGSRKAARKQRWTYLPPSRTSRPRSSFRKLTDTPSWFWALRRRSGPERTGFSSGALRRHAGPDPPPSGLAQAAWAALWRACLPRRLPTSASLPPPFAVALFSAIRREQRPCGSTARRARAWSRSSFSILRTR